MYYNGIIIVLVLILIYLLYISTKKNITKPIVKPIVKLPEPSVPNDTPIKPGLTTGGDRLPDEDGTTDGNTGNPNYDAYKDIPRNSGCSDEFSRCAEWADNGECEANPDFMLQNCPNSCKTCDLSYEQKSNLVNYYLHEPLKKCIYRGEPYPPGIRLNIAISEMYR